MRMSSIYIMNDIIDIGMMMSFIYRMTSSSIPTIFLSTNSCSWLGRSTDSTLMDFLACADKCEFHVTSCDTQIYSSPECSPWPRTKSRSTKIGHSMKSQGIQSSLALPNFYRCFIYRYPKSQSCLCILPTRVLLAFLRWVPFCFSALKKAFHHSSSPYPLDPGHSNHSQDWCLWLCTHCCPSITTPDGNFHPIAFHSWTFSALELNYDVHDKELLAIFEASNRCGCHHQNLQYFSTTKILMCQQARWSEYLSGFNLIIHFRPGKLRTKPDTLTRWWDIYLKRGIVTMPVSIHRTTTSIHFWATGIVPPSYYPINPSPLWISHHGCWKAPFQHLVSTPRWSHFHRTPWQSVRPSVDPWSQWFTSPPQTHLCSKLWQSLTMCSPVLAQPSPCRTFQSKQRLFIKSACNTIGPDFQSMSRTTENCAPLFPHQTYRLSQATSDSREALEFHIHGFHREAPPSSGYTSIIVIVDLLSKQSLFILTHDTLCHLNLHNSSFYMSFPSMVFQATSLLIVARNSYPTFLVPQNCIGHEAPLHFQISSWGDGQTEQTNQTLKQYLWVYCNYQQDNWSELLPLAEFTYNNTLSATTSITPSLPQGLSSEPHSSSGAWPCIPHALMTLSQISMSYTNYSDNTLPMLKCRLPNFHWFLMTTGPRIQDWSHIYIKAQYFHMTQPSKKLSDKFLSPYEILALPGTHSVTLWLPDSLHTVHPVFHISMFGTRNSEADPDCVQPPPHQSLLRWTGFEISEILDSKMTTNVVPVKLLYLVRWTGYWGHWPRNFLDPRFRRLRCISIQFEVLLKFSKLYKLKHFYLLSYSLIVESSTSSSPAPKPPSKLWGILLRYPFCSLRSSWIPPRIETLLVSNPSPSFHPDHSTPTPHPTPQPPPYSSSAASTPLLSPIPLLPVQDPDAIDHAWDFLSCALVTALLAYALRWPDAIHAVPLAPVERQSPLVQGALSVSGFQFQNNTRKENNSLLCLYW